jgi:hypothetical protein
MIQERILQYLEVKKITPYRFSKELGLSIGFLNKRGSIGTDKYLKIIQHYSDINPEWLLTGDGSMIKENQIIQNNKRIEEIEALNVEDQKHIYSILDTLIRDAKNRK